MKKMILALALLAVAPSAFAVELDQAYLNFGMVNVITAFPQTQYVTVSNNGNQAVGPLEVVSNCFLPDFDVQNTCYGQTLQPNQACQIWVTFKPSHIGYFDCTIRLASTSAPGESDIQVTGQGM